MLTTGAFQLLYGRLYSTFSIKYVFISSISIFELGSLVCGVTPSSIGLIIGRAIAGVGAAGLFSGALIILAHVVPLHKRPTFMGAIGGMWGIASVAGPLLGGVFTVSHFSLLQNYVVAYGDKIRIKQPGDYASTSTFRLVQLPF